MEYPTVYVKKIFSVNMQDLSVRESSLDKKNKGNGQIISDYTGEANSFLKHQESTKETSSNREIYLTVKQH